LKYSSSGTAVWAADNNTTYSVGDGGLTTNDFTNADHSKLNGIAASATANAGDITAVTAGSGMSGGGTSGGVTLTNAGVTSIVAGSNVSISGATGAVTVTATDTNTTYSVGDGGLTTNNFTDADHSKLNGIASSANNYSHPSHPGDDLSVDTGALSGATVISDIDFNVTTDSSGHVTDANGTVSTRSITLANLGYSGATNANYITNNNQLSNGAGYTTATGDITGVNAGTGMSGGGSSGTVTLTCTIDSPSEVGLGNLSSSGNVLSGSFTASGNITAYSDERLKENIQTLDGSKVLRMRGVSYTKKENISETDGSKVLQIGIMDGGSGSGVIAQELELIAPELVLTNDDAMGIKSVAYGNLVGYLIEAVKDLSARIDELEDR